MASQPTRHLRAALLPRLARLTRYAPTPLLLRLRPAIGLALRQMAGGSARLERNMGALLGGTVDPAWVRAYWSHAADVAAYSAAVFRSGVEGAGLEGEWTPNPEVERACRDALEHGKGVILVGAHMMAHEILVGTAAAAASLPVTVLVRKAPDPAYEAIKQQWYAALKLDVVYRPSKNAPLQGLGEMTAALRVLRKNRMLALTPDLIRKPGTGIPVQFFGRTAELPAGPFFLSVKTGAPLVASYGAHECGRYRIWCDEPTIVSVSGAPETAIADAAQDWASRFEAYLRRYPDMWQFWLDKRWEQWIRQ